MGEKEATTVGNHLTSELRAAYDTRASASDEPLPPPDMPWGFSQVATYLHVTTKTVRQYLYQTTVYAAAHDGQLRLKHLPSPDGRLGRGVWWWPATIIAWDLRRPGQGAGGGRRPAASAAPAK